MGWTLWIFHTFTLILMIPSLILKTVFLQRFQMNRRIFDVLPLATSVDGSGKLLCTISGLNYLTNISLVEEYLTYPYRLYSESDSNNYYAFADDSFAEVSE